MEPLSQEDCLVERLGENTCPNPSALPGDFFRSSDSRVLVQNITCRPEEKFSPEPSFERPGPFRNLFFNPAQVNVGIVTCGGLCPGLNDVIRSITFNCLDTYHIKNVYGFRNGFAGLAANQADAAPILLNRSLVHNIHEQGGTFLGSSRGPQNMADIVDCLVRNNISILFVIGGGGSQRAAMKIVENIKQRELQIAVIGIPKTIDNDLSYVHKTFGFDTAVEEARRAINAAHVEAKGAHNGIGLVKLMGRDAGFIAAHATLASGNVNICLIPEAPVDLSQLFTRIRKRLAKSDHLVIVVAEGVGQNLLAAQEARRYDESGNPRLKDIGLFLKQKITEVLHSENIPHTLKYIDPSYMIRSTPANAVDSSFCLQLGNYAVHAGLAGRTNALISYWNQHFCLVPIGLVLSRKKKVNVSDSVWHSVIEVTE